MYFGLRNPVLSVKNLETDLCFLLSSESSMLCALYMPMNETPKFHSNHSSPQEIKISVRKDRSLLWRTSRFAKAFASEFLVQAHFKLIFLCFVYGFYLSYVGRFKDIEKPHLT